MRGRPCIRGQRIRVTDILELLGAGASFEEVLADYSFLEREDILAAIEYAAHQADHAVLQTSLNFWLTTSSPRPSPPTYARVALTANMFSKSAFPRLPTHASRR